MEICNIIDENIIDLDLDVESKEEALLALAKLLKQNNYIDNLNLFLKDIYKRELAGVTGIGQGIAIPHGKSKSVKKTGVAIGKTRKPIKWESIDGKKVQYIFLFSVGSGQNYEKNHMKLLAQFAGRLGNDQAIKSLKEAKDVSDIKDVFKVF